MRKKQNTKRNLAESMHKIYSYGIAVTAGFIVGFDTEKTSIGDSMAAFIDDCAVPVAMVGLLYALPGTQLTRRLEKEGRLHKGHDVMREERAGDQCSIGLNFEPKRPLRDILTDYKRVVDTVYAPENFARRLEKLATMLDRQRPPRTLRWPAIAAAKRARPRRSTTSSTQCPAPAKYSGTRSRPSPAPIRRAALHHDPDVALHAPRPVLATRHRPRSTAASAEIDDTPARPIAERAELTAAE